MESPLLPIILQGHQLIQLITLYSLSHLPHKASNGPTSKLMLGRYIAMSHTYSRVTLRSLITGGQSLHYLDTRIHGASYIIIHYTCQLLGRHKINNLHSDLRSWRIPFSTIYNKKNNTA